MMKNKMLALGFSVAFMLALFSQHSRADVIGDTYDLGATIFNAAGGGAFIDDGPPSLTFDGTTKLYGNSVFGAAGDQIFVTESQVQTGNQFVVSVTVFAQDAAGNLTTWVAPGTTFDNDGDPLTAEVPFDIAQFDLASGNGGVDTLDVDQSGGTYAFVQGEALIITSDPVTGAQGTTFTFGIDSGGTAAGGPTGNFSGGVAFNFGDLGAPSAALGGVNFSGYAFEYTYTITTAVPEPGSLAGLLLIGLAGFASNRRRRA